MEKTDDVPADGIEEVGSRQPSPMDIYVGCRVRLRRLFVGMSQEQLGGHLGISFQQVQKYEKGVNRIGASRLFELSQVLQVPVQFFFDENPVSSDQQASTHGGSVAERPTENIIVHFLYTREGLELNRAFVRIKDARIRRSVVDHVRSLAGEVDQ
jgi:transcriptional regulator with XRE-family HTH domain